MDGRLLFFDAKNPQPIWTKFGTYDSLHPDLTFPWDHFGFIAGEPHAAASLVLSGIGHDAKAIARRVAISILAKTIICVSF